MKKNLQEYITKDKKAQCLEKIDKLWKIIKDDEKRTKEFEESLVKQKKEKEEKEKNEQITKDEMKEVSKINYNLNSIYYFCL